MVISLCNSVVLCPNRFNTFLYPTDSATYFAYVSPRRHFWSVIVAFTGQWSIGRNHGRQLSARISMFPVELIFHIVVLGEINFHQIDIFANYYRLTRQDPVKIPYMMVS